MLIIKLYHKGKLPYSMYDKTTQVVLHTCTDEVFKFYYTDTLLQPTGKTYHIARNASCLSLPDIHTLGVIYVTFLYDTSHTILDIISRFEYTSCSI